MSGASLYEDHWLLAYEAHEHDWTPLWNKIDYVKSDSFFSILQSHSVEFYGSELVDTESYFSYGEEEIEEETQDDDDEDEEDDDQPILP